MSNDMQNDVSITRDAILPDDPAAGDAVAESMNPKMVKRTVALHVGYVGTGYKGEARVMQDAIWTSLMHVPLLPSTPSSY